MHKTIASGLIVLEISLLSSIPLSAQDSNKTEECRTAIANAKNQLENGRQLQVVTSEMHKSIYSDYPKDRPYEYSFSMEGAAVEPVLSSPVLLSSLAKQIINTCSSVSLVSFARINSDIFQEIGLMPNGKVELFQCPADFEGHPYWRNFRWGESC